MKKRHHNAIRLLEGAAAIAALVLTVFEIRKHVKKEHTS